MRKHSDRTAEGIRLHSQEDFAGMRQAGALTAKILDMIGEHVRPGVSTQELNDICHQSIIDNGAKPAPLNYRSFPKSICTSVNHVVCHGIPSGKKLNNGDIINIDITVILDGWHGDSSRTFAVGKIPRKASRLIDIAHDALMLGIETVKPDGYFADIGKEIERFVESKGCSVVRQFCGHGLGRVFHDAPNVLHYAQTGPSAKLRPGMFFTIEPMVNIGSRETRTLADGWTAITRDRSLSAQFEHSVGVTEDGVEVFTLSPGGIFHPLRI